MAELDELLALEAFVADQGWEAVVDILLVELYMDYRQRWMTGCAD